MERARHRLHARVDRPLRYRLESIADAVITDYRREEPTMATAEWKQAQQALAMGSRSRRSDRQSAGEAGDLRRARHPSLRARPESGGGARHVSPRGRDVPLGRGARRQLLRSLPRDQPDRRLRSRRRRSGRDGGAGSRKTRLCLWTTRAGAPRRRLLAARDGRTGRPHEPSRASSAGGSWRRRAPTIRAASTPSTRSSASAMRRRTSKSARANSNASTKSSPPKRDKAEGI